MPDYAFPNDLLDLQRAYNAADARCHEIGNTLPGARAIVEDGLDVDFTELGNSRAARLELAVQLQQDPWWKTIDKGDRVNARLALKKAARADD